MPRQLTCVKCGTLIKGGYYNAPSGAQCCDCWEHVPESKIIEELQSALDLTKQFQQSFRKRQKQS